MASACGPARRSAWRLVAEKVPLFALSAASCTATLWAQHQAAQVAVSYLGDLPLGVRVGNALVAYVRYIGLMFWPRGLAVLYPHPGPALPAAYAAGAGLLLASITVLVLWAARRRPYLPVGWFWYLGTLVPVLGLVQVGFQALADRYTYVPLIGLFLMGVWGVGDLAASWPRARRLLVPLAAVLLGACVLGTRNQVAYWHDEFTLWNHTLQVTEDNWIAHGSLGVAYLRQGREEMARRHLQAALRINPQYAEGYQNLGVLLVDQGRLEEGRADLLAAWQIQPDSPRVRQCLALVDNYLARREVSLHHGARAVELAEEACTVTDAQQPECLDTLAAAYAEVGRFEEAAATARKALALASRRPGSSALVQQLQENLRQYEKGLSRGGRGALGPATMVR